jgi:menaquinone-9 beta-reductase
MSATKPDYDVIIAGAGPAGSSAAIHLAANGARVLLVEQKKFPRPKLCGEFISPECLKHFARLGIPDKMLQAGGEIVTQTVFYSRSGRHVKVPSSWFDNQHAALGLSRAEMDHRLLERARAAGVNVLEETHASALLNGGKRIAGLQLKSDGKAFETTASIVIDATGRARSLSHRLHASSQNGKSRKASLVAFKAHLENARPEARTCEIYFYPGGYGGLSRVENGLSNLCFIAASRDVRECQADPETAMRALVEKNSRAAQALAGARVHDQWLAVSLESFGRREPVPLEGLLSVGDAAAFIDPFSGSGMLMALEGGALAASSILKHLPSLRTGKSYGELTHTYREGYRREFGSRLRVCALLRRAAFVPSLADVAIRLFGLSDRLRHSLAQATRATVVRR